VKLFLRNVFVPLFVSHAPQFAMAQSAQETWDKYFFASKLVSTSDAGNISTESVSKSAFGFHDLSHETDRFPIYDIIDFSGDKAKCDENKSECEQIRSLCVPFAQEVVRRLQNYGDLFHRKFAEGGMSKLDISTLADQAHEVSPVCREATLRTYLVGSVLLYKKFNGIAGTMRFPSDYWLKAALLNNIGKVEILTARAREAYGGIWNKKVTGKDIYKVLGGYDCLSSKIYIDVSLAPYDLGATFIHEFDHLERDKLTGRNLQTQPGHAQGDLYIDRNGDLSSRSGQQIYWPAFILQEETLSVLLAAQAEYIMWHRP
jgi:hypothetical protein